MRVLIAEDDPLLALALAERLRRLGHQPVGPAGTTNRGGPSTDANPWPT